MCAVLTVVLGYCYACYGMNCCSMSIGDCQAAFVRYKALVGGVAWHGVGVTRCVESTKLLYSGPG